MLNAKLFAYLNEETAMNIKKLLPIILVTALTSCSDIGSKIGYEKAYALADDIENSPTFKQGQIDGSYDISGNYFGISTKMLIQEKYELKTKQSSYEKVSVKYSISYEVNVHNHVHSKVEAEGIVNGEKTKIDYEYYIASNENDESVLFLKYYDESSKKKKTISVMTNDYEYRKYSSYTSRSETAFSTLANYVLPSEVINRLERKQTYDDTFKTSYYSSGKNNLTIKADSKHNKVSSIDYGSYYYDDSYVNYHLVAAYNNGFIKKLEYNYKTVDNGSNAFKAQVSTKKSLKIKLPSNWKRYLVD